MQVVQIRFGLIELRVYIVCMDLAKVGCLFSLDCKIPIWIRLLNKITVFIIKILRIYLKYCKVVTQVTVKWKSVSLKWNFFSYVMCFEFKWLWKTHENSKGITFAEKITILILKVFSSQTVKTSHSLWIIL